MNKIVELGFKAIAILASMGMNTQSHAQGLSSTQKLDQQAAEWLQGSYRYNTVVAVLVVIFLGIWLYLYRLSKRIGKIERNVQP